MYDTIIIGGGAAGCFGAVIAAQSGARVLLIERSKLMHKLGITGKGRCNLTNNCGVSEVIANLPVNGKFLHGALSRLTPSDVMAMFEEWGAPLKTERGGRVFPVSDKAADITAALDKRMKELGVKIVSDRAREITVVDGRAAGVIGEKRKYEGKSVILATGGMSYSKTGSTGDGYRMAEKLGHTIVAPKPSLVPIITREDCSGAAGLSLKNVTLSLYEEGKPKPLFSELGEMLFTHEGVSGPLVLSASSYVREAKNYTVVIDIKPALDEEKLDLRLLREFGEQKNKELQNVMRRLLPQSLIPLFLARCGLNPQLKANEVTREQRKTLVSGLKAFKLTVERLADIEQAIITDGGIDVREINPSTMESKLVKSLYFAGEIIDVTGFTGGFNLQAAFSTAYTAAINYHGYF